MTRPKIPKVRSKARELGEKPHEKREGNRRKKDRERKRNRKKRKESEEPKEIYLYLLR